MPDIIGDMVEYEQTSFAMFHCKLNGIINPFCRIFGDVYFVNYNLNIVNFIPVDLQSEGDFPDFSVDTNL